MSLQQIIKQTLTIMRQNGDTITPLNYHERFCEVAKSYNVVVPECNSVANLMQKLDSTLKAELKGNEPRSIDELFSFITAKLNRIAKANTAQELKESKLLIKRMAQVAQSMHNSSLSDLASYTLRAIDEAHSAEDIQAIKNSWMNFLTAYDDGFLDKLALFGTVNKESLEDTVKMVINGYAKSDTIDVTGEFKALFVEALEPSIAQHVAQSIAQKASEIINDTTQDPQNLYAALKALIVRRINSDKEAMGITIQELDTIASQVSKRLLGVINRSKAHSQAIASISQELGTMHVEDKLSTTHAQLLKLSQLLEEESLELTQTVQSQHQQMQTMQEKIKALETQLRSANREKDEDFLTKVLNKRALDEKLKAFDQRFKTGKTDFVVLFMDIDFFKKINDTYGHDAGDAVLITFAKVLKKHTKDEEVVARFGGEEFVLLLPDVTLKKAHAFANELRKKFEKSTFVFHDVRIKLTVSGGVALRSQHESAKAALKSADEALYEAKQQGRNAIYPKL